MARLGGLLAFFGFGSAVLDLMGRNFAILAWAEKWQPILGLVVGIVGAALLGITVLRGNSSEQQPQPGHGGAPGNPGGYPPPGGQYPGSPAGGFAAPGGYPPPNSPAGGFPAQAGHGPGSPPGGFPQQGGGYPAQGGYPQQGIPQQGPQFGPRSPQGPPQQRGPQEPPADFGPRGGPPGRR